MLDLRQDAATEFLAMLDPTRGPDDWPPAVRALETEADAPGLFEDLGRLLDQFEPAEVEELATALRSPPLAVELRAVLAQTGAARVFSTVHWLGDERTLAEPHLLVAALTEGGAPEARALRATIGAVTRRTLLARLFAPDRVTALHAATETAMQEPT
ncbi:MAG: hypothetical protein ABI369_08380 [Acetobacteraceae bacterium]